MKSRQPNTALHARILRSIEHHGMIATGERLGVAVSGGADSVALLRLLDDLRTSLGISLVVLHFHHGLRGAEADADERFVAELARERGLEFLREGEDSAAWARAHRRNLEDAGRELRHAFFRRVVHEGRARRVAVAHTADDQAETVLAHLFRGAGLAGLAGIYPVVGDVVRPLLEVRREALRDWLDSIGQAWREDSTNADTRRTRARLRIELLPLLERNFQPQIVARLGTLGGIAREEEAFWSALVDERFRALAESTGKGIEIGAGDLLAPVTHAQAGFPAEALRALSRRLLRQIVKTLVGDNRGLTSAHMEQVLQLAGESLSGRRVILPRGLMVEKSFHRLLFSLVRVPGTESAVAPSYEYPLELPVRGDTRVTIPAIHRCVCLKVVDWPPAQSDTNTAVGALDADLLHPPFLLRNWQPGDVYRPRGRQRARKVKFLFRESRIAARDRSSWPVLTSQGRVVWVPGLPVAAEFAARRNTRLGLLVSEETI